MMPEIVTSHGLASILSPVFSPALTSSQGKVPFNLIFMILMFLRLKQLLTLFLELVIGVHGQYIDSLQNMLALIIKLCFENSS